MLDNLDTYWRGDFLAANGGNLRIRDGKTFVAPRDWKPEMAKTKWTFSDRDILAGIRLAAEREAKGLVAEARQRLDAGLAARTKRTPAPNGAAVPPVAPEVKSPVTAPSLIPGASVATPVTTSSRLSSLLNL